MNRLIVALFIVSIFLLNGCASTKLRSSWNNPDFNGPSLQKILIIAVSNSDLQRRLYEESFVEKLQVEGVDAVASHTMISALGSDEEQGKALIKAAVVKSGADGALITTLSGIHKDKQYIPASDVYAPGHGGSYTMYGYYGYSHGIIFRHGSTVDSTLVNLNTAIFSTKTEEMLWSGDTQSVNPDGAISVVNETIDIINGAIKKAGII